MVTRPVHDRHSGQFQRHLLNAYQPIRVWLAASGVLVFVSAAAFGDWWEGYVAASLMAGQLGHSLHRLRNRDGDPWPVLFVDVTVIGVGASLFRTLTVTGLAFALIVTVVAALAVPPRKVHAWAYTASWFIVALTAHEVLGGTSVSGGAARWVNLAAVIVFIPSIGALVASASGLISRVARSRDEFMASVAHEIRTPLSVVVGLARELSDAPERFTGDEAGELAQLISEQSTELAHIVDDLLVASRVDGGALTVTLADLDLCLLAEAAIGDCGPFLDSADSEIRIMDGGPIYARADRTRVRQIIRNLLTNALKYGGPEIEVECSANADCAFIEVRDNGVGVPEEARERIFQPYERAHDPEIRPGSVGLGLAVSTQLAELMGGEMVYLYSDEWSVFRLALPLVG